MGQHRLFSLVLWGVGTALLVGVGWEIYEALISFLTVGHINDIIDTGGDILFDILGGLVVAVGTYVYQNNKISK